ncbi:exported hypothetical protein [Mesorhizobium sp. STM 4661]|nr:exported hypothetical protein [Mesorhizobium sp. STM 4661]
MATSKILAVCSAIAVFLALVTYNLVEFNSRGWPVLRCSNSIFNRIYNDSDVTVTKSNKFFRSWDSISVFPLDVKYDSALERFVSSFNMNNDQGHTYIIYRTESGDFLLVANIKVEIDDKNPYGTRRVFEAYFDKCSNLIGDPLITVDG